MKNIIEKYTQLYTDFLVVLYQSAVVLDLADTILDEFPDNLPENIAQPYNQILSSIFRKTSVYENENEKFGLRVEFPGGSELESFIALVLIHINAGHDEKIDFNRATISQRLIMLFAHFDAFLADSLRVVGEVEPKVMMSKKNITIEKVLSSGNWDVLVEKIVDDYITEFGMGSIVTRINYLNKRLKLNLRIDDEDLDLINEAENLRHAFVHNGGRVSSLLMRRIKRNDLVIGSEIHIDEKYMDTVHRAIVNLSAEVYKRIATKYLGIDLDESSMPIWTTGVDYKTEKN